MHALVGVGWLWWLMGCWVVFCGPLCASASADQAGYVEAPDSASRTEVKFRVLGPLNPTRLASLQTLIEAELAGGGVSFVVDESTAEVTPWVTAASREPDVLLIVVLDTRKPDHWRLTIVDAARLRAIRRRLPGGVEQDAAAVEAVASIVVSAATALRDGLEVASQPVDEVLAEPEDAGLGQGNATRQRPIDSEKTPAAELPAAPAGLGVRAMLLASAATFAREQRFARGWGGALGFTFSSTLTARATAATFQEVVFDSSFGEFGTRRALFGLGFGAPLAIGDLEIEPEARFVFELLTRKTGEAIEGVTALERTHLQRYGGVVGVRTRYPSPSLLGLEAAVAAGYLLPALRFVTNPNNDEIAELWPWLLLVELGMEFNLY